MGLHKARPEEASLTLGSPVTGQLVSSHQSLRIAVYKWQTPQFVRNNSIVYGWRAKHEAVAGMIESFASIRPHHVRDAGKLF